MIILRGMKEPMCESLIQRITMTNMLSVVSNLNLVLNVHNKINKEKLNKDIHTE